jgi:hypothetical protein
MEDISKSLSYHQEYGACFLPDRKRFNEYTVNIFLKIYVLSALGFARSDKC